MFSHTVAALEKFDNQHDFERMSADILNSLGYKNVVPIAPRGGSDGGMDITFTTNDGKKGLACVTLRKDIDAKGPSENKGGKVRRCVVNYEAWMKEKKRSDRDFDLLAKELNERTRRLLAASEAIVIGRGGIAIVSRGNLDSPARRSVWASSNFTRRQASAQGASGGREVGARRR